MTEAGGPGSGNGRAAQRDVYAGGARTRLEIDTNDDGVPDVVQYLAGDEIQRQEEDSDFDGTLDRAFAGDEPAALQGPSKVPPALPKLDCGRFDVFWQTH